MINNKNRFNSKTKEFNYIYNLYTNWINMNNTNINISNQSYKIIPITNNPDLNPIHIQRRSMLQISQGLIMLAKIS